MAGIVDKMSYALSVRDYNEVTREVTIKHYRIRKLDRGGVYISPKKTFSDLLQLVDHYHSEYIASCSKNVASVCQEDFRVIGKTLEILVYIV